MQTYQTTWLRVRCAIAVCRGRRVLARIHGSVQNGGTAQTSIDVAADTDPAEIQISEQSQTWLALLSLARRR
jgi:hypothetical protein